MGFDVGVPHGLDVNGMPTIASNNWERLQVCLCILSLSRRKLHICM